MTQLLSDISVFPFLQNAVIAAALTAVACGIIGSYVVSRQSSYIAGALSHCMLAGLGAARYLERVHAQTWASPLLGALIAAVIAAFFIAALTIYGRERRDTVLSAVWAIGMAVGITFIYQTPGYSEDLMSYLFGDILLIAERDLWLLLGLNCLVLFFGLYYYNTFLAIGFNEEFARLRGVRVELFELLLLLLTAVTVVLLVQVVGIVMSIALLTLPAATAMLFSRELWKIMLISVVLTLLFTLGGLAVSYGPGLPTGATIIELAGAFYLGALLYSSLRKGGRVSMLTQRLGVSSETGLEGK